MEDGRRIFGIVTRSPVRKEGVWKMSVEVSTPDEENTKEITIIVDSEKYFLPIENGDRISAAVKDFSSDTSSKYELLSQPLVFLFNDEKNLLDFFSSILRFSGKGIYVLLKEKTHSLFLKNSTSEDDYFYAEDEVISFLNKLSVSYSLLKNNINLPFQEKDNITLTKILKKWYGRRVLRQLYLLGLTKKEIFESGDDPLELYEKCLSNPFKVPSISIDNCKRILGILDKIPTQEMVYGGRIMRYLLSLSKTKGWSYCPEFILKKEFPSYGKYTDSLKEDYSIVFDGEKEGNRKIYYLDSYLAEVKVGEYISALLTLERDTSLEERVDFLLEESANAENARIKYTPEQLSAIKNGVECWISIISGGAGCGKTTAIKKIVNILDTLGKNLAITSFTGKAVVRICEVLSERRASTMDYLITKKKHLDSQDMKMKWMEFEYLIIDEMSMVPTELFYRFISVFTHPFKIILIGDNNQLPPIGCGGLFEELLSLGKIPTTMLLTNHRLVSKNSNQILFNANTIIGSGKTGEVPILQKGAEYEEILSIKEPTPDPFNLIQSFYENRIPISKFRVLCPFNEPLKYINTFTQELYSTLSSTGEVVKEKDFIEKKGKKFYIDDEVMMLKNDSNTGLKNGSVGRVVEFNEEFVLVEFDFLDERQSVRFFFSPGYDEDKLGVNLITLSYATTIHKSQGSEYDIVIVYIPKRKINEGRAAFLNYKMLYTAITRAKKYCWVIGDRKTFYSSLMKIPSRRYEYLSSRILGEEREVNVEGDGDYFEENYDGDFI